MTKFRFSTAWPCTVLALTAVLAAGPMTATAAAQTREDAAKSGRPAGTATKQGAPSPVTDQAPPEQAGNSAAPSGGLNVVIDPETGKLRGPDRAEATKFGGPAMNRTSEGLRPEVLPNGATVFNLQGRFQTYSVATLNSDGKIELKCRNTQLGHSHADHNGDPEPESGSAAEAASEAAVNNDAK